MPLVRVHNLAISLDGYGAGAGQSLDAPFGHVGMRLMDWFKDTSTWAKLQGREAPATPDDAFARRAFEGIGVEIMGAGKSGPPGWQDDAEWRGWWGDEPPFHSPVVVLTHRPRSPLAVGETTFHFLDARPGEAVAVARELAGGLDIRLGGGPSVVRDFLAEDRVDHLHVVVVPIILGRGSRLWDGLEGMEERLTAEAVSTPSGVTHVTFARRAD